MYSPPFIGGGGGGRGGGSGRPYLPPHSVIMVCKWDISAMHSFWVGQLRDAMGGEGEKKRRGVWRGAPKALNQV